MTISSVSGEKYNKCILSAGIVFWNVGFKWLNDNDYSEEKGHWFWLNSNKGKGKKLWKEWVCTPETLYSCV